MLETAVRAERLNFVGLDRADPILIALLDADGLWETNNRLFKPDSFGIIKSVYLYKKENDPGERLLVNIGFNAPRYLRSFYEAAAYATKSKSLTAGAEGKTRGSIHSAVDMDKKYKFDNNHSAQWQLRFQKNNRFYQDLIGQF